MLMEFALNSLGLKKGLKSPYAAYYNSYNLKHASIGDYRYIIMKNYMENWMKHGIIFILMSSFSMLTAQTYCAGEQVSTTHQNQIHEVCAGFEDYASGDPFRLSDYNGELNGGNYHIIFIDMSASW